MSDRDGLTGDVFTSDECEGAAQFVDRLLNDSDGRDVDVETDALLDMIERILTARSADMEARIRALVEELRTSRAPDETRQSIKLRAALASRLAALLDAAPAGGAEAVDQEGHEIYWDGLGWTHVNRLLRGQCPAIPAALDGPSEVPHD